MSSLTVVVGGFYGSEGKGHVTGYLAAQAQHDPRYTNVVVTRVGGPNAGHIVYGLCPTASQGDRNPCVDCNEFGHPWRLRQIPVGAVTAPQSTLVIAPGSEIDLSVLYHEIDELDMAGYRASKRLVIDKHATILTEEHKAAEAAADLTGRIGSTGKGIGAARADRLMRTAHVAGDDSTDLKNNFQVMDSTLVYRQNTNTKVIVEGTQGYALGLHTDNYPYTTSGNCRAIDFLAQAGISPWNPIWTEFNVFIAARAYPIRVAGNSGNLEDETSWAELGLPEEKTTVTQKVRRVGKWDPKVIREAIRANGGGGLHDGTVKLALTMADHLLPELAGKKNLNRLDEATKTRTRALISSMEQHTDCQVSLLGTSPTTMMEAK